MWIFHVKISFVLNWAICFNPPNPTRSFWAVWNKPIYFCSLFLSVSQLIAYVCAQLLLACLRVERGKGKKRCLCGKEIPHRPPKSKATNNVCSSHTLNGPASLSLAGTDNYFCKGATNRQLLSKYSLLNYPPDSCWVQNSLCSIYVASLTAWHWRQERPLWWFPVQSW